MGLIHGIGVQLWRLLHEPKFEFAHHVNKRTHASSKSSQDQETQGRSQAGGRDPKTSGRWPESSPYPQTSRRRQKGGREKETTGGGEKSGSDAAKGSGSTSIISAHALSIGKASSVHPAVADPG